MKKTTLFFAMLLCLCLALPFLAGLRQTSAAEGARASDNPEAALQLSRGQRAELLLSTDDQLVAIQEVVSGGALKNGCIMRAMAAGLYKGGAFNDRAYLSVMIAHHEAGQELARSLRKDLEHSDVIDCVEKIESAQNKEIRRMRALLTSMGDQDAQIGDMMKDAVYSLRMRPVHDNADTNLMALLMAHRTAGMRMAMAAVLGSSDAEVVQVSKDIVDTQLDEIVGYKRWLMSRAKE